MIAAQELRKIAREKNLPLDLVEKDYVLGWILYGIYSSRIANSLAFKGGTALSKIYFPLDWRLSEDLDFTLLLNEAPLEEISTVLSNDVPDIITRTSGISVVLSKPPFSNPSYLQSRFQYQGPICKNTVKIEITTENYLGDINKALVPQMFDYPSYSVNVYTLDNILAEKIRALIERGKIKDYYDTWKLFKTEKFDALKVKKLFLHKCETKSVVFTGVEQFFPVDIVDTLKPHLEVGLTRLSSEALPCIEVMLAELKTSLTAMLS